VDSDSFIHVPGAEKRAKRLGVYELLAELGSGSTATVWLGRSPRGELVAVKVLKPEESTQREARERFAREALVAGRIDHPGIVRALDSGEERGIPYLVMEYVPGISLATRLAAGALSVPEAIRIGAAVARAMNVAHGAGVVHRDLKPANILLDRSGVPRVGDFGLARDQYSGQLLTRTGDFLGTPYYMAPEQVRGEVATTASDVWALGVLLHECLAGARPFDGRTVAIVARAILSEEPPPPSRVAKQLVPPSLDRIVAAALRKDPARRPSMDAIARDLEHERATSSARESSRPSRARVPIAAGLVGVLGFALGLLAFALEAPDGRPAAEKAARDLESVARTASSLRTTLERATKEKAAIEARVARLGDELRDLEDARGFEPTLARARLDAQRILPLAIDRALKDLEGLPRTKGTVALRARLLLHRGRVAEVMALSEGESAPDNLELARANAEAHMNAGQEDGLDMLRALADRDPEGARGLYARARTSELHRPADIEHAAELYERAFALDSSFGDALAEEALLLAALASKAAGPAFERALALANRAVANDPTSPRAFFARSYVTWDSIQARKANGEPIPAALADATCDDLRVAFALDGSLIYRIYSGKTLVVAGRPREGIPELAAAAEAAPAGSPLRTLARTWLGNARMSLGDEAAAVTEWVAALEAGPRSVASDCRPLADGVQDEGRRRRLIAAGLDLSPR
jgi:serine/threonine-protein kinase